MYELDRSLGAHSMSEEELLKKIAQYIDKRMIDTIQNLSEEERKALKYFMQNISVGAIIAVRELKAFHKIQDPKIVIRRLIDKGLVEQGYGCYNLAKPLREALFSILKSYERNP